MQNSTNMRILELLRFLYERTDENHPATVSDIIAHLNGKDVPVERYDDGHFTAKIEVNPSGTFYGWIFKFKGKIKILSPKECITEIQQIAQEFI